MIIGLKPISSYLTAFNVFPNPVSSILTIEAAYQADSQGTIEIIDMFGKSVKKIQWDMQSPIEVNLSQNAGGLYVLKLRNDKEVTAFKLIKL